MCIHFLLSLLISIFISRDLVMHLNTNIFKENIHLIYLKIKFLLFALCYIYLCCDVCELDEYI